MATFDSESSIELVKFNVGLRSELSDSLDSRGTLQTSNADGVSNKRRLFTSDLDYVDSVWILTHFCSRTSSTSIVSDVLRRNMRS